MKSLIRSLGIFTTFLLSSVPTSIAFAQKTQPIATYNTSILEKTVYIPLHYDGENKPLMGENNYTLTLI